MLSMRRVGVRRHAGLRLLSAAIFVLFGTCTFIGATSGAARADDRPFWEQDGPVKKAKYKKTASRKNENSYASGRQKKYANKSTKKLGGYAEASEPKKKKGYKVAALGGGFDYAPPKKSLSGGSVSWSASSSCLDSGLRAIIYDVAANYGPLRVNSTCRSKGHNAAVGGAPRSKHLSGDAVDFRVSGNVRAVYAYLRNSGSVGGLKHYGGGLFHIDNGERRSW